MQDENNNVKLTNKLLDSQGVLCFRESATSLVS